MAKQHVATLHVAYTSTCIYVRVRMMKFIYCIDSPSASSMFVDNNVRNFDALLRKTPRLK